MARIIPGKINGGQDTIKSPLLPFKPGNVFFCGTEINADQVDAFSLIQVFLLVILILDLLQGITAAIHFKKGQVAV